MQSGYTITMSAANPINRDRLVQTFLDLVRINSPSFAEGEIGSFLAERLQRLGCEINKQDYGRSFNLIAVKKGNRPGCLPLMLSGHMDTVEPTVGIVVQADDSIIRSTGATVLGADDKSALAQIMETLEVITENGMSHGDIEIVLSSGEEKGLEGARNLAFEGIRSSHSLVLDSSGPVGGIVVGAPTHITYEMTITGRAAHAGIEPEKGISAIRAAARVISEIPDGRIDADTTANIGIISGGTATNVVPRKTVIHGELRSHDAETLQRTKDGIFSTAHRICGELGARIDITEQEEYRAFRISGSNPFLLFMINVFRACGIEPAVTISGGGSDANIYNQRGITTLNLSTGMQKVHSGEEFIMVEDLCKGAEALLQAVKDFAGFRPSGMAR